jgi:Na+-translocating ferredoxin:NAD+ oxidoreductase RNF subunit RnfB
MGKASLTPVIQIDKEKCINCYACITGCPVKYCMNGSGEKLTINSDMCIGCGNCINICTHNARSLIDDAKRFFDDLKRGEK